MSPSKQRSSDLLTPHLEHAKEDNHSLVENHAAGRWGDVENLVVAGTSTSL